MCALSPSFSPTRALAFHSMDSSSVWVPTERRSTVARTPVATPAAMIGTQPCRAGRTVAPSNSAVIRLFFILQLLKAGNQYHHKDSGWPVNELPEYVLYDPKGRRYEYLSHATARRFLPHLYRLTQQRADRYRAPHESLQSRWPSDLRSKWPAT